MYGKESAQMSSAASSSASLLGNRAATKQSELTKMVHNDEQEDDEEASDALLDHQQGDEDDSEEGDAKMPASTHRRVPVLNDAKLQAELDQILFEERTTPVADLMILMTLFVVVLAINMLKGGGAMRSPLGIKCGSQSFWMANAVMIAWIVVVTLFVRQYLLRKFEQKRRCQYPYVDGDIQWNAKATIAYPVVCCMAGLFAGMFGVGGGIVKGPLMLAMGVHPAVAAASSAVMILFTSFTATTSFLVFGLLVMDYAAICLVIGFLATLAGQIGLSYLMKRAQRNSYIAFSIGGVVLLSAILMTFQSLLSMAAGEKHHAGGICGKGD
jgi:Sulfite exporter TauE/SafE